MPSLTVKHMYIVQGQIDTNIDKFTDRYCDR